MGWNGMGGMREGEKERRRAAEQANLPYQD